MIRFWFKTGMKFQGENLGVYLRMYRARGAQVAADGEVLVGYASRKTGLRRGLEEVV